MIVSAFLSVINADNAYENLFHCMAVDNKMNVTRWKCWKLGEPNILYPLQVKCCRGHVLGIPGSVDAYACCRCWFSLCIL